MHLGVHCINVYVRDQDRSLKFYTEQLGFRVAFDAKLQSGERWVAVAPPDGEAVLALIKPKTKSQEAKLIGRSTQIVFLTDDVAARFREWSSRGVKFSSAPKLKRVKFDEMTRARAAEQPHISGMWTGIRLRWPATMRSRTGWRSNGKPNCNGEKQKGARRENWRLRAKCRRDSFRRDCRRWRRSSTRGCVCRLGK